METGNITDPRKMMEALEREFERACVALAPLRPGARVLLGCSAGGDSMAMLALAARLRDAMGWTLAVAHLDHGQRVESAGEAAFVREQAAAHGVEAFVDVWESPEGGGPSEDAMRAARHACFRRRAEGFGAGAVMLAHQADDRAETFLIRLLAGAGPTGLGAIRPLETLAGMDGEAPDGGKLILARPLLGVRRAALREYLEARGLPWRDDPSNDTTQFTRGWVRHVLLPAMAEGRGHDPVEPIARASALIADEAGALREATGLMLDQMTRGGGGADGKAGDGEGPSLDLTHPLWRRASGELRRQLLREWLWRLRAGVHPPGLAAVEEALKFVEAGRPGARLRTIEALHLVHEKRRVVVEGTAG